MNRKLGIIAAIVLGCALCFALVGCGGASVDKSKFTGEWELVASSEDSLDPESLEMMKSLGLEVTLQLNGDDTGMLNLFGEEVSLTWKATSASEGTLTLEGTGDASLKFDGDSLVMEDASSTMTFEKK